VALLFAVSVVSGGLFGLIPVVKYGGPHLATAIRHGGRTLSQSRERHSARSTLVVVQVALALVLLVGSGLMIRTFQAMRRVQPGFLHPEQLQTLTLSIPDGQVKEPEQVMRMEDAIRQKIAQLPGVESVALASTVPMSGMNSFNPVIVENQAQPEGKLPPVRRFRFASPGFLHTLGNPLIAGRDFTWTDIYQKKPMAIVTENMPREVWGSAASAVGKRIRESTASPWREVVGVAGLERDEGVDHPAPTTVYWPVMTPDFWGTRLQVRRTVIYIVRSARTGSQGFLNEVRQAVWSVNPNLPLLGVKTMQEIYTKSMART
jgi:putative ABC transport system permease protein